MRTDVRRERGTSELSLLLIRCQCAAFAYSSISYNCYIYPVLESLVDQYNGSDSTLYLANGVDASAYRYCNLYPTLAQFDIAAVSASQYTVFPMRASEQVCHNTCLQMVTDRRTIAMAMNPVGISTCYCINSMTNVARRTSASSSLTLYESQCLPFGGGVFGV